MHLSDHDLRQLDDAYLAGLTPEQARALLSKALADLKAARERLAQDPSNSSRPPSSRAPWEGVDGEPADDRGECGDRVEGATSGNGVEEPSALQDAAVAWRQGKLVARGMRVADFVDEIGRYRTGFTLCDAAVADLTISGVFSTRDTDRALQSLADSLPVALSYRTDCACRMPSSGPVPRAKALCW